MLWKSRYSYCEMKDMIRMNNISSFFQILIHQTIVFNWKEYQWRRQIVFLFNWLGTFNLINKLIFPAWARTRPRMKMSQWDKISQLKHSSATILTILPVIIPAPDVVGMWPLFCSPNVWVGSKHQQKHRFCR